MVPDDRLDTTSTHRTVNLTPLRMYIIKLKRNQITIHTLIYVFTLSNAPLLFTTLKTLQTLSTLII